jgi:hypothetical protein
MHPSATAGRRRALPRRAEAAVGITAGAGGEAQAACSPAVFRLELRCYPARYPEQKFVSRIKGPATRVWSRSGGLG